MEALTPKMVQQHVEAIQREGFSIMRDAIDDEFHAAILAELERLQRVRPGGDIPPAPFTAELPAMVERAISAVESVEETWMPPPPFLAELSEIVLSAT